MLVVMVGLPAPGKSAVAEDLARALDCAVLSVDPVEAAMWRAGISPQQPTGLAAYLVVEALASEQLALDHDVVIDAVNAVEPAATSGAASPSGRVPRCDSSRCAAPTRTSTGAGSRPGYAISRALPSRPGTICKPRGPVSRTGRTNDSCSTR